MENKKILVAYYSKSGNTERVAKNIAQRLNADMEKIIDKKNRGGLIGFITGGRDAMKKKTTEIGATDLDPAVYDLIIMGTPVWAGDMVPAVRSYLAQNKEKIKNLAFFETSGSTASEKIAVSFEEAFGKKCLALAGLTAQELKDEKVCQEKIAAFVDTVNARN
jgi:flavodoxin